MSESHLRLRRFVSPRPIEAIIKIGINAKVEGEASFGRNLMADSQNAFGLLAVKVFRDSKTGNNEQESARQRR